MTKCNIYTDLAAELRDIAMNEYKSETLSGIESESYEQDGINITWVKVTDKIGAKTIGKPIGNYITIESPLLRENDIDAHDNAIKAMCDCLGKIHNLNEHSTVLVIGLGNWNVTPDALGPKVISKLLITRHIKETLPDALDNGVRSVAALSPGVMGITGIETFETVKGLVERVKPDLVIAVDALASRSVSRINATIQISDTGVAPGAGMGNKRKALNEDSLGVKVIAVGVPTVVDAATLANDTIDNILEQMADTGQGAQAFFSMLGDLGSDNKYQIIKQLLDPYAGNMFVTPKDVDAVIDRLSGIIANALNISLHLGITKDDINRYMY